MDACGQQPRLAGLETRDLRHSDRARTLSDVVTIHVQGQVRRLEADRPRIERPGIVTRFRLAVRPAAR
jgi:hypothetical protein